MRGGHISTTLGRPRARDGTMEARLREVLVRIAEAGKMSCEVVGVVSCLHEAGAPYAAYPLGPHLYCELDAVDVGQMRALVAGMADRADVVEPSQTHLSRSR